MTDPWTTLGPLIGGGGALAVIAALIVYVTRAAIATAVTQAGAREMERLKSVLAKEMEKERQAFTREIERDKQEAARALEEFKATLTLDAEVRRQAAAKKVGALMKVADLAVRMIGRALYDPEVTDRIKALDEYWIATREAEAVVPLAVMQKLWAFGRFL